jgi:Tetratricopeptide repeat
MRHLLVGLSLVGLAVPALAQDKRPDRTAMYQDVEVMRRLLTEAITQARAAIGAGYFQYNRAMLVDPLNANTIRVTGSDPAVWSGIYQPDVRRYFVGGSVDDLTFATRGGNFFTTHWVDATPPPTDGTYLKGVGPVFNLTLEWTDAAAQEPPTKSAGLASNCAHCHGTAMDQKVKAPPAGPKREPPDPWDAKLRQLRGEKDPPAAEPPATRLNREEICLPGNLTELVLNSLTNYGHRFRELPPGERITVILTLKPAPTAAADATSDPAAQVRAQAEEQLALGDLHAKQGKSDESVAAYRQAVEILSKPLGFTETAPHEQVTKATEETTKALRNAHGKLAQALLTAGKLDEAKAAIEAAKGATVSIKTEKAKSTPPTKPPLPNKLTVSLAKKAIDDHKAGKTNLFELRSAAEVEAVGFPAPEAKPAKP